MTISYVLVFLLGMLLGAALVIAGAMEVIWSNYKHKSKKSSGEL